MDEQVVLTGATFQHFAQDETTPTSFDLEKSSESNQSKHLRRKENQMKKFTPVWFAFLTIITICPVALAQEQSADTQKPTQSPAAKDAQEKNVRAYVDLLRSNVRQQKAEIMGAVMQLDVDEAGKFWPIYSEYNAELTKLNNLRLANIQDYARNYDQLTDSKADELVQKAIEYRKQRSELLAKYYGRVKTSLGAVQAARFVQIEDQLLLLIDLQIASALPLAGQGS